MSSEEGVRRRTFDTGQESVFHDIVKTMPQNSTTGAVLKDADHFFFGREKELMKIVGTHRYAFVVLSCLLRHTKTMDGV